MLQGILGIVVAVFLGALIGLQREFTQQHLEVKSFAGFRTFILASFLGSILGYLTGSFSSIWVILGFCAIVIFSVIAYFILFKKANVVSGTTEISFIFTYILGVMCTTGYMELAIIVGILIATFLTFKERLHKLARNLETKEIVGMVEFALIAFVVLPFLPNKNYSLLDIPGVSSILNNLGFDLNLISQLDVFNPHLIWLMVIFIAGLNLLGYFSVKFVGQKKGYGLIGFLGGLISSTAVAFSMAKESKENKKTITPYLLAILIASSIMFLRVLFEVAIINPNLLFTLGIPLVVMVLISFFISFIFYKKDIDKKGDLGKIKLKQPFSLGPALKFGLFFLLILFLSKLMGILFGSWGIYVASFISGFADVDAIVLSLSNLALFGTISETVASTAILISIFSNTLIKSGILYFLGNKKLGRIYLFILLAVILLGLVFLFFI